MRTYGCSMEVPTRFIGSYGERVVKALVLAEFKKVVCSHYIGKARPQVEDFRWYVTDSLHGMPEKIFGWKCSIT